MNLGHPLVECQAISIGDDCTFGGVRMPLSVMQEPTPIGISVVLQKESLRMLTEIHGADHDETLQSSSDLGSVLANVGRYREAAALWEDTLKRQRRLSGHNSIAASITKKHLDQLKEVARQTCYRL